MTQGSQNKFGGPHVAHGQHFGHVCDSTSSVTSVTATSSNFLVAQYPKNYEKSLQILKNLNNLD
jgi:hypothetical protein